MNFSREKETKEIVVNSNNQEDPQNISKSLLINYNHQATQTSIINFYYHHNVF